VITGQQHTLIHSPSGLHALPEDRGKCFSALMCYSHLNWGLDCRWPIYSKLHIFYYRFI